MDRGAWQATVYRVAKSQTRLSDWQWHFFTKEWPYFTLFTWFSLVGFLGISHLCSSSDGKDSACNAGDLDLIPALGRSPGEGNGNPLQYSCLENPMDKGAWWATESQRVGPDWVTSTHTFCNLDITKAGDWPILLITTSLPLAFHVPQMVKNLSAMQKGHTESDTTERLHFHFSLSCTGEGNGNPLQCSCLENPRDGGAWWAAVYGVPDSRTWLKWLSSSI